MNLYVLVLPGVLDGSLGVTLDAAHAANRLRRESGQPDLFAIRPVAHRARHQATAAGLRIGPLQPLAPLHQGDVVVVPGANAATPPDLEAWLATAAVRHAVRWLAQAFDAGARVAAACTGTFVAAEAGLLSGRSATTTWWLAPMFRQRYPDVAVDLDHMVVTSGSIITAGAALAQADLMLVLIGRLGSARLASACARYLLIDRRQSQSRFAVMSHLTRQDPFVMKLEKLMEAQLTHALTAEALARAMHVSTRTLARRVQVAVGLSPMRLLQRLRTERALHLIEASDLPIDEVAARVGYTDAATLRRLLKRSVGLSPSGLRAQRRSVASSGSAR